MLAVDDTKHSMFPVNFRSPSLIFVPDVPWFLGSAFTVTVFFGFIFGCVLLCLLFVGFVEVCFLAFVLLSFGRSSFYLLQIIFVLYLSFQTSFRKVLLIIRFKSHSTFRQSWFTSSLIHAQAKNAPGTPFFFS